MGTHSHSHTHTHTHKQTNEQSNTQDKQTHTHYTEQMETLQNHSNSEAQQIPHRTSLIQTHISTLQPLKNTRETGSRQHHTTHPSLQYTTQFQTQTLNNPPPHQHTQKPE